MTKTIDTLGHTIKEFDNISKTVIPTITQITEKVELIHELEQDIKKCSE